jgi:predicted 3-demethylubiquinone-9 3-methyltransferase (glyoxalase superfamily)
MCQWLAETFGLTAEDARAKDNFAFHWAAKQGRLPVCQWIVDTFGVTGRELYGANDLNRYFYVIHNAEVCGWLRERFGITLDYFGAD